MEYSSEETSSQLIRSFFFDEQISAILRKKYIKVNTGPLAAILETHQIYDLCVIIGNRGIHFKQSIEEG